MSGSEHRERVVVAMSGGVDSSAAAALLAEEGYEVLGVTLSIWPDDAELPDDPGRCCSLRAVEDARRVAGRLDIPHYVLNFQDVFEEKVINNFCQEYLAGRTPNPCIVCNHEIKFKSLLKKAMELEARYMATGHYARRLWSGDLQRFLLKKGLDEKKDQSYALYRMTQMQLAHTLFPLGKYTKDQVRTLAETWDLPVHKKPESQEICFIPDDDYHRFLRERRPDEIVEGPILDTAGHRLGTHDGLPFYTIGQRRGLGIATGEPLYVVDLVPENNAVIVGKDEEVYGQSLVVDDYNLIAWEEVCEPFRAEVKIRYNSPAEEATVSPDDEGLRVDFRQPVRAITPGQAAVFYRGETVIGGGIIAEREIEPRNGS